MVLAREEGRLDAAEYAALVRSSGLPRPVDDLPRMAAMLAGSDLVATARDEATGRPLGAGRSVTDSAWCCYLPDPVVAGERQRGGLGRLPFAGTKRAVGSGRMLLPLSTHSAMGCYPRLGMERMPGAFPIRRDG